MSPTPPDAAFAAAATAAAQSLSFAEVISGDLVRDADASAHVRPDDDPTIIAVAVSGTVEGTVHLAIGDEFFDRLEYASDGDDRLTAVQPMLDAIAGAFAGLGPIEFAEPAVAAADSWPGVADTIVSAPLIDGDDTVIVIAFAFAVHDVVADHRDDPETDATDTAEETEEQVETATETETETTPQATPTPTSSTSSTTATAAYAKAAMAQLGGSLAEEVGRLADIVVDLAAVLGETSVPLHELLAWLPGSIISLDRAAGTPADLRVDGTTLARGEVVVVDENYGLRLTELDIVGPGPRAD